MRYLFLCLVILSCNSNKKLTAIELHWLGSSDKPISTIIFTDDKNYKTDLVFFRAIIVNENVIQELKKNLVTFNAGQINTKESLYDFIVVENQYKIKSYHFIKDDNLNAVFTKFRNTLENNNLKEASVYLKSIREKLGF